MSSDLPQDWQVSALNDLITVHHGFAFKGEFFRDAGPGDLLVTPGNFAIGGGFSWSNRKYYDGPVDERYLLRAGEMIVTMTDLSKASDTLGSPAIVPPAPAGSRLLHNQRIGRVEILAADRVHPDYLYSALRNDAYRRQIVASATGTTVKHTSPKRIGGAIIALPPIDEQRRIARVLSMLDDKIDSNRRLVPLIEGIVSAVFKAWFVDFVGVDEFEESEIGQIPQGWNVAPIGDSLTVVGGGTPSTKEPRYWDGGIHCWATPKDLARATSPILLDTQRRITSEGVKRISSRLLPERTVLLSSRAPVGYTAMTFVDVAVNQGFIAIPPSDSMPSEYVLMWLRENMDQIKAHAGGTTFAEISKRAFRPLPMLVPSPAALTEFQQLAATVFDLLAAAEKEARVLTKMRDALLPRLTSGEIRVLDTSDAHEAVGSMGGELAGDGA
jgi:type I restriction enzyme S subunit